MGISTKNLLIIGSTLGPYGGMEAFMITLAEAATHWPEFEVKLCFKMVKGHEPAPDLVEQANAVCSQVYFVQSSSLQLLKLITWADVLHIQNTPPDVVFSASLLRKKILLTVHNWRRRTLNLHNVLWGLSVQLAHRRWFNSKFVWDTWEPNEKSATSDSFPTVSKLPEGWCPPEQRRGFLFIGRWIPGKGLEEIVRAYSQCNLDPKAWPLTLLGNGPLKPTVLALITELGLTSVNLPGFVEVEVKEKLLASTCWLLAPANTKEDLGLTPIEARNVGVPSIVTRDGGLPEAGGPAALVAEPGDVDDLARCMRLAVDMGEQEYRKRGELAKASLDGYLRPLTFYRDAYNG
ncbi:hypothetical protein DDQ68_16965 [Hymenobacter nivis]|uniref:Glycosyl transferase family 1 domain-containing protein n=1 Tax=Hymenobacter nivis TaxID=1850093 RepID=A0A2Z3GSE8_9BACT|nr:hypothetical protein DDQ68_16965 [Hymenobacter nivis]